MNHRQRSFLDTPAALANCYAWGKFEDGVVVLLNLDQLQCGHPRQGSQ